MLEDAERTPQGHIQFLSTRWSLVVNAFGFRRGRTGSFRFR